MNIYGIGNDIIEIDRVKKALNRNIKLLEKMFSSEEIMMFSDKNYKAESIAGNFAAKEAVVKSIGTGLRGFSLKEVQILRDELNKPTLVPTGKFKAYLEEHGITEIKVTIAHCKTYATATAIAISN